MMKKHLLLFSFLCMVITIDAQMYINNPQDWWGQTPASLDNIEIEVRTIGAYSETAIAFDVRMEDMGYFYEVEQLEFVFDFQLNEGVVMNDSWLWIDDYISLGQVYEQGEGTQIYESIVDRQQDPSILTQVSSIDYNLKIYPLKWDSTRRVRLSYLEPLNYIGKQAFANLPLGLLKHSATSPEDITITIYNQNAEGSDGLSSNDWLLVEEGVDFKVYKNSYVFDQADHEDIWVSYSMIEMESDHYLSTFDSGDDTYYQLIYYPDFDVENTRENNMVLFDFDSFSSSESHEEMKHQLKQALMTMGEEDYFIICYSDFVTKFTSDNWMPATLENIEGALAKIELTSEFVESRMSSLVRDGFYKVEELNLPAEITLLSPNNEYYLETNAKPFLNSVLNFHNQLNIDVRFSIVDYANSKINQTIDGITYYGNDYVYIHLAEGTGGSYFAEWSGDNVYNSLVELFSAQPLYTEQYDFQISVEDGFVYSDYDNLKDEIEIGSGTPIISTGKYVGEGLFDVKISAKSGEQIFTDNQLLDKNHQDDQDTMIVKVWNSEYIKALQHSGDITDKRKVIQTSINERLLSLHTVFLCLEPELESISANNGENGDVLINTEEEDARPNFKLKAYPNPFVKRLNIEFELEDLSAEEEVVINIFNSKGQLIDKISRIKGLVNGMNAVVWEPLHDLTDGLYVVQLVISERMYNQSVLHVRS